MTRNLACGSLIALGLSAFSVSGIASELSGSMPNRQMQAADSTLEWGSTDVSWGGLGSIRMSEFVSQRGASADALNLRGAKEIKLFRDLSPAVVIILTDTGFGSGSVISEAGLIVTNWHVVGDSPAVGVIFKPGKDDDDVTDADIVRGDVTGLDRDRDLALVKVSEPLKVKPIPFGDSSEIQVGADVHAIGHPTGATWTYTKGIISQVRRKYEWLDETGGSHRADVIQTQTPINAGNSGGPLISDSGKLVGINSFKVSEAEGVGYAIALGEIKDFVRTGKTVTKSEESQPNCKPAKLYEGRDDSDVGKLVLLDTNCDGLIEIAIFDPDDRSAAIELWLDEDQDDIIDGIVYDIDRDGKWDESDYDVNADGQRDLTCKHQTGDVKPTSCTRAG